MRSKAVTHAGSGVPSAAGQISHAVIAELLTRGEPNVSVDVLDDMVRALGARRDASLNAKRVRALALTTAAKYLSLLRPTCTQFLGAEVSLGTGRADLVWLLPDGDVFIDELKTERYLQVDAAVEQASRYVTAGVEMFGDGFVGVRVVSATHERHSLLVDTNLRVGLLSESPLAIPALRPSGTAEPKAV